jgi:uncharacterized protein
MKNLMMKNICSNILLIFLLIIPVPGRIIAQDIPEKPFPPRLVNDFAGMLKPEEANALERKLVEFNDSTSTQIAIVIVSDLKGYDKADFAQRLGEKWSIGQKGFGNGLLILIKPKTEDSPGQVFIAQGYGLEGAIPDLKCSQIVDDEILPAFRARDFYGGLDKATSSLMYLANKDFGARYRKHKKGDLSAITPFIGLIIFFIILMLIRSGGGKNQRHISNKGLPLWLLFSMMNSGRNSHNGSWGGFSGGGGFGGGSGGGFGGFGGGGFGGGGAGGSW